MNIELIRQNLKAYESEIKDGSSVKACEMAFLIARMLISQAGAELKLSSEDEEALRAVYRAYVGTANELNALFCQIEPNFDSVELVPKLKERIKTVNEIFRKKREEFEKEEEQNAELLAKEEELKVAVKELSDLKEKVLELTCIQEKDLMMLQKEVEEYQQKLIELKKTCEIYKEHLFQLQAELNENSELIKNMPDTIGVKSVDELIEYAKKAEIEMREQKERSDSMIDQIICGIENVQRSILTEPSTVLD